MNFRLKDFRNAKNIKQSEIADLLGLNQSGISRIEKDGLNLNDEQIEKLEASYGVDAVSDYKVNGFTIIGNTSGRGQNNGVQIERRGKNEERLLSIIERQSEQINALHAEISKLSAKLIELLENA